MVHHNKPNTLSGLRKLIQAINARYWERCGEVSCETCTSGSSRKKTKQKYDSSKSDNKSGKGSSQSKQRNNNSGSTQSKGSTSKQKKSTTPDLSSKLGRDGAILTTNFASFVPPPDTSPRIVQNLLWPPPRLERQRLISRSPHPPTQI